jgi:transcriptional regulator with XRE-family HTH domain
MSTPRASDFRIALGRRIRELRNARGWSEAKLAYRLCPHWTRKDVWEIETPGDYSKRTKRKPRVDSLDEFADVFGITRRELLDGLGDRPSEPVDIKQHAPTGTTAGARAGTPRVN